MGAENHGKNYQEINGLGRHLLCELYGCHTNALKDVAYLTTLLRSAARSCGAVVVGELSKGFAYGGGVSVIVLIQESHLAIHTWPEHGYVALDIFTCGELLDPWSALKKITEEIRPLHVNVVEIRRGLAMSLSVAKVAEERVRINGDNK